MLRFALALLVLSLIGCHGGAGSEDGDGSPRDDAGLSDAFVVSEDANATDGAVDQDANASAAPTLYGQLERAIGAHRVILTWPHTGTEPYEVLVKSPTDTGFTVVATVTEPSSQDARYVAPVRIARAEDAELWTWKVRRVGGLESAPWSPGALLPAFSEVASGTTPFAIQKSCFTGDTLVLGLENGDVVTESEVLIDNDVVGPFGTSIAQMHGFEVAASNAALIQGRYAAIAYRVGNVVIARVGDVGGTPAMSTPRYAINVSQPGETLIGAEVVKRDDAFSLVTTTASSIRVYTLTFAGPVANRTATATLVATHTPAHAITRTAQLSNRVGTTARVSYVTDDHMLATGVIDLTSASAWALASRTVCAPLIAYRVDSTQVVTVCAGDLQAELVIETVAPVEPKHIPLPLGMHPLPVSIAGPLQKDGNVFTTNDLFALDEEHRPSHFLPRTQTAFRLGDALNPGGTALVSVSVGFAGIQNDQMHIAFTYGRTYARFDGAPLWWIVD